MVFDPCEHKIRMMVIDFGKALRRVQGLPEENNVTILYKEALKAIGVIEVPITSRQVNHLPAPHEMKDESGKFIVPRKDCPRCGKKDSMLFGPLCISCEDAKGENGEIGKYKSMYQCGEKDKDGKIIPETGCGYKERLEKFFSQILNELKVDFRSGTKESLGIKTFTDNGVR